MTRKTAFLVGAMTAREMAAGRYLRDGEGHEAAPAAPAEPTPTPAPAPKTVEEQYDEQFSDVEVIGLPPEDDDGDAEGGADDEGGDPNVNDNAGEEPAKGSSPEEPKPTQRELDLQRQLDELKQRLEKPTEVTKPKVEDSAEDKEPNPEDYEFGNADSKFIADYARWNSRQEFSELQYRTQVTEKLKELDTNWKTKISDESFVEKHPDFDQLVTQGAKNNAWQCSPTMAVLLKSSDVGPDVAYQLAKNPEESRRIAGLSEEQQVLEFGRMEGRALYAREVASTQQTPAPRPTQAPTPPAERSRGAGGKFVASEKALYDRMLEETAKD